MRMVKYLGGIFGAVIVMGGMVLNFSACAEHAPMSSELSSKPELNILKFGSGNVSLKKMVEVSRWVTQEDGGDLILDYKGSDHDKGNAEIKITLKVFSEAISEDADLTLSLDDQQLDLTFAPHGITFEPAALLNIDAKKLDLSGVDPDQINIYYDNPETGQWEAMSTDEIVINERKGHLKVVNAQLPHFSRYAIGWGDALSR